MVEMWPHPVVNYEGADQTSAICVFVVYVSVCVCVVVLFVDSDGG